MTDGTPLMTSGLKYSASFSLKCGQEAGAYFNIILRGAFALGYFSFYAFIASTTYSMLAGSL